MNTIPVNFMTRAVGRFANREHGAGQSGKSMADAIAEAARRAAGADGTEDTRRNGAPQRIGPFGVSRPFDQGSDDDKNDRKRKSEIIVKPDGTRYLVISEVVSGMKVMVMSVKLTEPDELMQDTPDLGDSGAAWSFGDV